MSEYTAIVKQDGDWWIGWIEEVPGVNCQESSRDAPCRKRSHSTAPTRAPQPRNTSRRFASPYETACARPLAQRTWL